MKVKTDKLLCCGKMFLNKKAYSNHKRWCDGRIEYKNNGYAAIHKWVRLRKPKPSLCIDCKKNKPIDLANTSGEYKRDINDYDYLCRGCHKKRDYTKETKTKLSLAANNRLRNERGCFL